MPLSPGTRVGSYEVVSAIGAGAMGEVYCARDRTLNRNVALKLLAQEFAGDPALLSRLEREAQALAALNHPNIATIYGFEQASNTRALALELVEGPTLAERIEQGPLPVDEAQVIARQIIAALEASHGAGIVHRDLKPANIKVRTDGMVKVLDFGLAKPSEAGSAVQSGSSFGGRTSTISMMPTMESATATGAGMILGTAAYMGPEQARGRVVDKRADIWAFGCVLFEMLAGSRAFKGESVTDVLADVLKSDPDWTALPSDLPPAMRIAIERCLAKDPAQRFRDIGDVGLALAGAFHSATVRAIEPARAPANMRRFMLPIGAAGAVVAAAAAAAGWWMAQPEPARVERFAVPHAAAQRFGGNGADVVSAPDGTWTAYLAGGGDGTRLYMHKFDELAPTVAAPATIDPANIFVSPDGASIGFYDPADRMLKKVSTSGGPPLQMAVVPPGVGLQGAAWATDDRLILGTGNAGLLAVTPGGTPTPITTPDAAKGEVSHRFPRLLPGQNAALFTIFMADGQADSMQIAVVDLESKSYRVLVHGGGFPVFVPSGHIVYGARGTLRAVAFDLDSRQVRGNQQAVVDGVITKTSGAASFDVSASGTLNYIAGAIPVTRRTLVWVDRAGREEPIGVPPRAYAYAYVSPDGTRLALDVREEQNDIWSWDLTRGALSRLTSSPGTDRGPVWTPDGKRIAYSATSGGRTAAFIQAADGSAPASQVSPDEGSYTAMSFSPDGRYLLLQASLTPPYDIFLLDLSAKGRPTPLLAGAFSELNGVISPDGRWIAYQSNESGRDEIYVRPFPDVNTRRWQVSSNGGTRPLWSRDGRELFYYLSPGVIMSAAVRQGDTFEAMAPQAIVKGDYAAPQTGRMYDVSPDGRRFLLIKDVPSKEPDAPQLIVVKNWLDELQRLVR
jgi:dipeptidyl aminopeptidase/acylaminoacyl peptidase